MTPLPGLVEGDHGSAYVFPHTSNDGFIVADRLLKAGGDVYWRSGAPEAKGEVAMYAVASPKVVEILRTAARELGISFTAAPVSRNPGLKLTQSRIGRVDLYGESVASGWVRWLLEQYEFPFARVYAPELDTGNLRAHYDVLIFADEIPQQDRRPDEPTIRATEQLVIVPRRNTSSRSAM